MSSHITESKLIYQGTLIKIYGKQWFMFYTDPEWELFNIGNKKYTYIFAHTNAS